MQSIVVVINKAQSVEAILDLVFHLSPTLWTAYLHPLQRPNDPTDPIKATSIALSLPYSIKIHQSPAVQDCILYKSLFIPK
jgi:hypothetical protein